MKTNTYFPHDSNAKDDPKCMLLIDQLGLEGYGIFWILIETLRDQPDFCYPLSHISILAKRYNTSKEKITAVVMNYHLFRINKDVFFYSESLINRMSEIANKKLKQSEGGKKGMLKRWADNKTAINQENQDNHNLDITNLENENKLLITSKVKESKVKESKVKENKEILIDNKIDFEFFWNEYKKKTGDKKKCKKKWDSLHLETQQTILDSLPKYLEQFTDKQYQPFPETYLNQERWTNEIIIKSNGNGQNKFNFAPSPEEIKNDPNRLKFR